MNSDILKGKWLQLRGAIKQKWGDLTDDQLTQVDGNFDRLVGFVQERYGYTRDQAHEEVNSFLDSLDRDQELHRSDPDHNRNI